MVNKTACDKRIKHIRDVRNSNTPPNQFQPEKLSTHILDQLWQVAERHGNRELQNQIEEVVYRRLSKQVERNREKNGHYN